MTDLFDTEKLIKSINSCTEMKEKLECIGITVSDDISYKIYQISDRSPLSDDRSVFVEKILNRNDKISLYDYSERVKNGKPLYSFGFLSGSSENYEILDILHSFSDVKTDYELLGQDIKASFDTDENNIIQFGFLTDANNNILESKIYFTLRSKRIRASKRAEFFSGENTPALFFLKSFFDDNSDQAAKLMKDCVNLGYIPFLAGINESFSRVEKKLYFMVNTSSAKAEDNAERLYQRLGLSFRLGAISNILYKSKLYLKGFALSFNNSSPLWRMYYFMQ